MGTSPGGKRSGGGKSGGKAPGEDAGGGGRLVPFTLDMHD